MEEGKKNKTELLANFGALLDLQSDLLEKMLAAADKQNFALRRNNLSALNEALDELSALVRQTNELEKQRRKAQRQLEQKWDLPPASTLKELLAFAPPEVRHELLRRRNGLREKYGQLRQRIGLNNLLTKNALRFNTKLLYTIAPAPGQTYLSDGAKTGEQLLSFFDQSV